MARIQLSKGLGTFFSIASSHPNYEFICAGQWDGPIKGEVTIDGQKLVIPDNVKMIGYVDTEQRRKLLRSVTALIQPSPYAEPFGFNIIEAYLSGTPVITTKFGSFTELVKPAITGYRCDSEEEWSNALEKTQLLDRKPIWKNGLDYSTERIYPRFERFWQRIYDLHKSKSEGYNQAHFQRIERFVEVEQAFQKIKEEKVK